MLFERNRYYELRNATILIQRKFRDVVYEQNSIIKKGKAAMQIQVRYWKDGANIRLPIFNV